MFEISLNNVHKIYYTGKYPVHAVNGISLDIEAGDFVIFMGPSGSGKSTLLHLIGGVDRVTDGKVVVAGNDITNMNDDKLAKFRCSYIGFVFQFYNLLPALTVRENIELPMLFNGVSPKQREKRLEELAKLTGLEDKLSNMPTILSGGEQQRVAIARALANDPKLILLDEPTGNLDRSTSKVILDFLKELHRTRKKTFVLVTHDPFVAEYGDRIVKIVDGKIDMKYEIRNTK